jgi:hypothetical protein
MKKVLEVLTIIGKCVTNKEELRKFEEKMRAE